MWRFLNQFSFQKSIEATLRGSFACGAPWLCQWIETWWEVREHPWWCQRGGPNSLIISPQLDPLASPPWASTKHVCVCVFLFAFTLLSSSYRQLRSFSTEKISCWSLRHNWQAISLSFFIRVCVCRYVLNECSFVWQIRRAGVILSSGATDMCREVKTSWIKMTSLVTVLFLQFIP